MGLTFTKAVLVQSVVDIFLILTTFSCTDCYYGIISDHRPILPGQLWQHCTPLHDSEGAVESSWQEGVTNSLTCFTAQCPSSLSPIPPLPPSHPPFHPLLQPVHNRRWGKGQALSVCVFLILIGGMKIKWQMITLCLSSDTSHFNCSILSEHSSDFSV